MIINILRMNKIVTKFQLYYFYMVLIKSQKGQLKNVWRWFKKIHFKNKYQSTVSTSLLENGSNFKAILFFPSCSSQ